MLRQMMFATLALGSAAFKLERAPATPAPKRLGLHLRGGDATEVAKKLVYFTSGFMFLPAGRDVVSPGAEIMPVRAPALTRAPPGRAIEVGP